MFDAHVHLQDERLDDCRAALLTAAAAAGVTTLCCCGCAPRDWPALARLAAAVAPPRVIPAFGLHPWFVEERPADWLELLEAYLRAHPGAGVGEIGLDGLRRELPRELQRRVLNDQLALAARLRRPVTLHGARAWGELVTALRPWAARLPGFVAHAFSGSEEILRELLALGGFISFAGSLCDPRATRMRAAAAAVPDDRLLVETDSPDILPRGGTPAGCDPATPLNQPANLPLVIAALAAVRHTSASALARLTRDNAQRLFTSGVPAMSTLRRCVAHVALALLAAVPAAASTNYTLSVATDRTNALYRVGDPVVFSIRLLLDGAPVASNEVAWSVSKDGVPPVARGKSLLRGGGAAVTNTLSEPGFLLCRATFADAPSGVACQAFAGAAVDPLDIKPSLPPPADFDAFWAEQKRRLAAVPIQARLVPLTNSPAALACFDLQADGVGAPVSGYLARPAGAATRSLPAILTVHGAGVRSASLGAAVNWARRGMLALDINAHGIPNGEPPEYYAALYEGRLKNYYRQGRDSRETNYFLGMMLRVVRAIDVLAAQPEWDGRILVVQGSSQGGYQTLAAAGLDARVTFFAAAVPAGCDHTGCTAGRINGWPKFIATGETAPSNVVEAVRYFDAVNFASRSRVAGLVTVGYIDTTCPPTSVYAAYNALPDGKRIHVDIDAGHCNTPQASRVMEAAILNHVARLGRKEADVDAAAPTTPAAP